MNPNLTRRALLSSFGGGLLASTSPGCSPKATGLRAGSAHTGARGALDPARRGKDGRPERLNQPQGQPRAANDWQSLTPQALFYGPHFAHRRYSSPSTSPRTGSPSVTRFTWTAASTTCSGSTISSERSCDCRRRCARACRCAVISIGLSSTISSGRIATSSALGSCTWTTRRSAASRRTPSRFTGTSSPRTAHGLSWPQRSRRTT